MPITKKTSVGELINDFIKSKDPKFASDTKEERKKRALGAYYALHKNEAEQDMLNKGYEHGFEGKEPQHPGNKEYMSGHKLGLVDGGDRARHLKNMKKKRDVSESFTVKELLGFVNQSKK